MKNLTQRWYDQDLSFQNRGNFFNFQKKQGMHPPPSLSCALVKTTILLKKRES